MVNPSSLPVTMPDGVLVDSVELAQTYMENAQLAIKDIQFQLGEPSRQHPDEDRLMTEEEYQAWRRKAKYAMLQREKLVVRLRQYIRACSSSEAVGLLRMAHVNMPDGPTRQRIGTYLERVA